MNLLLLDPGELAGDRARLVGRRAAHLREVLGVGPGDRVRAGIVGGGVGEAQVLALDPDGAVEVAVSCQEPPPARVPVQLVLAVPRPKVLTRVLETAAAFGVERIDLVNAWRVDKAYLDSPRLAPEAVAEAVRLGAEQGAQTHLPEVRLHRRLMAYFDGLAGLDDGGVGPRLCAHPRAALGMGSVGLAGAALGTPVTLAIGPEGGWILREVDTFAARGFAVVSLGLPVLRVEAAIAAALGQLTLRLGGAS